MNKLIQELLYLVNIYTQIEIIGGLILVILLLGYLVLTLNHREFEPSVPESLTTIEQLNIL